MFKTTVKCDVSGLEKLRRSLTECQEIEGRAGFDSSQTHPRSETPLSDVAYYNHFGSEKGHVPKRPFFRRACKDSKKKVSSELRKEVANILMGKSPKPALDRSVKALSKYISDVIQSDNWRPRNAPYTILKKGFDNPLTETGYLANNVKTEVTKKDG